MRMLRVCLLLLIVADLAAASGNCARNEESDKSIGPVVATINGMPITMKEFQDYISRSAVGLQNQSTSSLPMEMSLFYLNRLIDQKLLLAEAQRQRLAVETGEVNEEIGKMGVEASAQKPQIRLLIEERMIIEKLINMAVGPRVEISPEEIQAYYEANSELFQRSAEVKARIITVGSRSDGEKLLKDLEDGADFAQLAKEHSIGAEADKGGDLGWVLRGWFPPELDGPLFSLTLGKVSKVIQSPYGFHLLLVEQTHKEAVIPLPEVKEQIKEEIAKDKREKIYQQWIAQLRDRSHIVINYQML